MLLCLRREVSYPVRQNIPYLPSPGTLGNSKHIGVQAIFNNQIPLIVNQTIVPQSQYSSRNVLTAFCLIINTAVIQSYNITENIKMIQIMKFGIDSRNTRLRLFHGNSTNVSCLFPPVYSASPDSRILLFSLLSVHTPPFRVQNADW